MIAVDAVIYDDGSGGGDDDDAMYDAIIMPR